MIIDRIVLNNFISHLDTDVSFSTGINVILGHNGAGKSSLMDAIRFALFGDSSRGNVVDLVHHGKKTAQVLLEFHAEDDTFQITRKITVGKNLDSKTDAEMTRNGEHYATGAKAVSSAVESLFRISSKLFFSSIFVKQGEIDQLVSEKPAERKKLFSQIIGIDVLEQKAETLKSIERRIRDDSARFAIHEEDITTKKDLLQERKKELEEKKRLLDSSTARNIELEKLMDEHRKSVDSVTDQYTTMKNNQNRLVQKKKELDEITQEIEIHRKNREKYRNQEEEYRNIENDTEYKSRDLIRSADSDMRETSLMSDQLRDLAIRLNELKKLKESREVLAKGHESHFTAVRELENLEDALKSCRKELEDFRSASRELEKKKHRLEEIRLKLSGFKDRIPADILSQDRNSASVKLTQLNGEKTDISGRKSSMESRIVSLKSSIDDTTRKMGMLEGKKSCPVCGSDLDPEHRTKVLSDYEQGINSLKSEIAGIENSRVEALDSLNSIQKRIDILNSPVTLEYFDLKSNEHSLMEEVESLQKSIESGMNSFRDLEGMESKTEELRKAVRDTDKDYTEYNRMDARIQALEAEDLVGRIESIKKRRDPVERRFTQALSELNMTEDQIADSLRKINDMTQRHDALESSMKSLTQIDENIRELEVRSKAVEKEIQELEVFIKPFPEIEQKYSTERSKLADVENRTRESRRTMDSISGAVQQLQSDLAAREKDLATMQERAERYSKIKNALGSILEIRAALEKDGIQKYLRKESSEAITSKARGLASEFGLDIDDIRVSEDFDVEVSVSGSTEDLSSLSGGEKTALAIALRMSVADYVLNRISTFIMDEPTTFLDEDRRGQLKNILQNSLRDQSIVPQLVIITHHQELTKAADMVYWVTKEHGSSQIEAIQ